MVLEREGDGLNFSQYIVWRIQEFFKKVRPCETCRGSNGHCDKCGEYHRLYKKDWQKCYFIKNEWRNLWW